MASGLGKLAIDERFANIGVANSAKFVQQTGQLISLGCQCVVCAAAQAQVFECGGAAASEGDAGLPSSCSFSPVARRPPPAPSLPFTGIRGKAEARSLRRGCDLTRPCVTEAVARARCAVQGKPRRSGPPRRKSDQCVAARSLHTLYGDVAPTLLCMAACAPVHPRDDGLRRRH